MKKKNEEEREEREGRFPLSLFSSTISLFERLIPVDVRETHINRKKDNLSLSLPLSVAMCFHSGAKTSLEDN